MIYKKYNKEWLKNIQVHLRAIYHICPDYWFNNDDPIDIDNLKRQLHDLRNNVSQISSDINNLIDKLKEKNEHKTE